MNGWCVNSIKDEKDFEYADRKFKRNLSESPKNNLTISFGTHEGGWRNTFFDEYLEFYLNREF